MNCKSLCFLLLAFVFSSFYFILPAISGEVRSPPISTPVKIDLLVAKPQTEQSSNWIQICVPIFTALIAVIGGGGISYYYWKRKERFARHYRIFDEKMRTHFTLSGNLTAFTAYTDLLMRADKINDRLASGDTISPKNPNDVSDKLQLKTVYEPKRVSALAGMRRGMSYTFIFYESPDVQHKLRKYHDIYDNIRKGKIKWDEHGHAFNLLLKAGKELSESMAMELKKDIAKWQIGRE